MAFKGDITLDGKEYLLTALPQKTFVNQMAPAIGQGESKYQDGTSWAAWIQKDWQDGIGKLDPVESGGFLYGEVDSRVPKQLILPQFVYQVDKNSLPYAPVAYQSGDNRFIPPDFETIVTVGAGGQAKVAVIVTSGNFAGATGITSFEYWLYARVPQGVAITFEVLTSTGVGEAAVPNVSVMSGTYTPGIDTKGFAWRSVNMTKVGLADLTAYWIAFYPTNPANSFEVAYSTIAAGNWEVRTWSGSAWAKALGQVQIVFSTNWAQMTLNVGGNSGAGFFRFNGNFYAYSACTLYKYSTVLDQWVILGAVVTNHFSVTSVVPFLTKAYFGNGGLTTTTYSTMSTLEVVTTSGLNGRLFAKYNGLLYRAYSNQLEYSDDGATWEPTTTYGAPTLVGNSDYPINAIEGLGSNVYCATAEGLFMIADGDFSVPVAWWGSVDTLNGSAMVSFQDALYIAVGGRLLRYTQDGHLQDVWMSRDDDLLAERVGRVWHMCRMNNWLVVLVGGSTSSVCPTVWALQNDAWHHLATLPATAIVPSTYGRDYTIYYDRITRSLWMTSPAGVMWRMYISDFTLNPYNDASSIYMSDAWIEWDWFDSPIFDVYKDYESVTIIGENISSTCPVTIYWKDDDSTGWELLGTATSNLSTVHWTIAAANRPATRRFKLGMLLSTSDASETPRIRAIRVKYMPMLRDWYQWNLQIDVAGTAAYPQEGINGEVNTRSTATIHNDLQTVAKGVGVYLYTDIDGTTYEVKVKGGNFPYTKFEYNRESGLKEYEGVWNLTLEQTEPNSYTP